MTLKDGPNYTLDELIAKAKARVEQMTPDELSAMLAEQRESWARGEMGIGNDAQEAEDRAAWRAMEEQRPRLERMRRFISPRGYGISGERVFTLYDLLEWQRVWSAYTFGPGDRTKGVLDHIRKELAEIEADPSDITEWIDVVILALDGAWRNGASPDQIVRAWAAKMVKNADRKWPDWRTASKDKAIEHDRTAELAPIVEIRLTRERAGSFSPEFRRQGSVNWMPVPFA